MMLAIGFFFSQQLYHCFKNMMLISVFFSSNFQLLEIIGTKEYRQPEWVTHMEEMREALKGKISYAIL